MLLLVRRAIGLLLVFLLQKLAFVGGEKLVTFQVAQPPLVPHGKQCTVKILQ